MLNVRFILKMLGKMLLLETIFMLVATGVAFLYQGDDFIPFLVSSGSMAGTGLLLSALGFRAEVRLGGRHEGLLIVSIIWCLFSFFGMLRFF